MKKLAIITAVLTIFFGACTDSTRVQNIRLPKKPAIVGLAGPVMLSPDTTEIILRDYFPMKQTFDSLSVSEELSVSFSKDSSRIILNPKSENLPKLSVLQFFTQSGKQSILLKKQGMVKHLLTFNPEDKVYKQVQMKGEMNAWNPESTPLLLQGGIWNVEVSVEPGNYQYIFVADGEEILDPSNPDSVSNGMGGYNSVLKLAKDNSQKPILETKVYDKHSITFECKNSAEEVFVFFDNFLMPDEAVKQTGNEYTCAFPTNSDYRKRVHIRVFAYNSTGFSNDLLIPLHKGSVLADANNLNRTDFHATVLYNTFVDRFSNGNPENDKPTPDPDILPPANYHGGDVSGIINKIDSGYFKKLGVNTIWVSPLVKNPEGAYGKYPEPKTKFSAYHGYWPISFTEVDERLGSPQKLKELVKKAHENDMNVLLDIVANHVHEEHPVYKAHPDWATNLYLPDGTLNTEKWDSHRLTTWFDTFLPTLDLSKPEVYNMLSDSAVYWIKEYNLDGFRHDATKHIPEIFWRTLTHKLKTQIIIPENKPIFQIGETYGSPELISSYVNTGQLNAQFDFNIYDAIVASLAGGNSFENFEQTLNKSLKYYGDHHLMGNITGNQDRGRFISYASGALKFTEDAKYAGWNREIGVEDSVGYKKSAMLNAVVATLPGLPVIYYGDEMGMPGGNDPDNRRMMRFNNLKPEELKLRNITTQLLHFRKNSMPLLYGETTIIQADENVFILERNYFGKKVYLVINNSDKAITAAIETSIKFHNTGVLFGSESIFEGNTINLNLKGNSFELIYN